ncbi:MAG: ketoacyl-ACP synthase III [Magnetococcales bacterium]|nr:ketoacyl-ACP synthase III [Magnetococcales bacterium]
MKFPVARIAGTGAHLPDRRLTNAELATMVDTTDEWIATRTGIHERRVAAEGEYTSTLGVAAARRALDAAGITADQLDMILVGTTTPDLVFPSTAALVQQQLGGQSGLRAPVMDVAAACSSFVYALSVAEKFIQVGEAKKVLVIGAETLSRVVDWTDRNTCILFGDGAGAVVLEAAEAGDRGILSTHIHADGSQAELLRANGGVSRGTAHKVGMVDAVGYIQMRGNEVFKQAVKSMGDVVEETLDRHGIAKSQVDWLVPHQANIRIIQATAKRLGMAMDQVVVTVDRHGNTSAASIPLALDEAVRDGRIKPGQLVVMAAFGGGFTWGSVLLRM